DAVEDGLEVRRLQRRAVRELHAFAQGEGECETVLAYLPRLRQLRHYVLLRVQRHEVVDDVRQDLVAGHGADDVRVEADRLLVPGRGQRAARLLGEGCARDDEQCGEGEGGQSCHVASWRDRDAHMRTRVWGAE